ncbi:SDR family oxidoreductase [bacterium]|nr:SDR family oxidoreductase [bacterium]
MARILLLGATGYIGGRLLPRLLQQGHDVRCLVRNPKKIPERDAATSDIVQGDVLRPDTLAAAFEGIDQVFYLVHSMSAGNSDFEQQDRAAATNVSQAAAAAGVKRIVYLGGLGKRDEEQSPHLRSRHEVGDILRSSGIPVTEFRAAVIVGSGSASFEMMHHLVNRLPAMVTPRWVDVGTQPLAIADLLVYLVESVENEAATGKIIDIGGPETLTYREMMLTLARVLGLRRVIIPVPVLTPKLSSYWVNLVTPIPFSLATSLIESVRSETVVTNDLARKLFDLQPMPFEEAVRRALRKLETYDVETTWSQAGTPPVPQSLDPSHLLSDSRTLRCEAPAATLFSKVASIGGDTGWYYANMLWRIRGFIDKQAGGVGLRRGRRHPTELHPGEALDFWRVEEIEPGRRLRLRAEMRVWGRAWLEFRIEQAKNGGSTLIQTAEYYPSGLAGLLYWYGIYPVHVLVFRGMARAIVHSAETAAAT